MSSRSTWTMTQNQDLCEEGGNNISNKITEQQQQQNSQKHTKTCVGEEASRLLTKQNGNKYKTHSNQAQTITVEIHCFFQSTSLLASSEALLLSALSIPVKIVESPNSSHFLSHLP